MQAHNQVCRKGIFTIFLILVLNVDVSNCQVSWLRVFQRDEPIYSSSISEPVHFLGI